MSILTYPLGFIGGGKEFYNGVMENSLRFVDDDSTSLQFTPSTSTSTTKLTFSCWFKLSVDTAQDGRNWAAGSKNYIAVMSGTGIGKLEMNLSTESSNIFLQAGASIRDPSAWYHLCVKLDTTHATSTERAKVWLNNE